MAKLLMIIGCVFIIIGLAIHYAPWMINWIGKLPGDIHIKNQHSSFFFPITSMIIISAILSIALRFFK